nr:uncharacterized protein LOC112786040 [Arachis hypogaea]
MELPSVLTPQQQRKKKNNSSMAQTLAMPIAPSLALISNPRPLSRAVYFPVLNPPKVRELSIECAQVGGVEIPNNKRIEFSLQYIHGIGRSRARKILCDISMDNKVTKDLSEEDLITLRDEVSKYVIEGDLRRFNALNIRRLNYDNVKLYVIMTMLFSTYVDMWMPINFFYNVISSWIKMYKRAIEEVVGFGSQIAKQFYLTWKCGQKIFKKVKIGAIYLLYFSFFHHLVRTGTLNFYFLTLKCRELAIMVSAVASAMPLDTVLRGHWRQKIVTFAFRASVATLSL